MTQSHDLFIQAQQHIPGGVNSPVRAFRGVGGDPLFFARGEGAYLYDEDGKRYVDYVGSWGPMIAGHAHPEVLNAVREAIGRGLVSARRPKLKRRWRTKCASWCHRWIWCAW